MILIVFSPVFFSIKIFQNVTRDGLQSSISGLEQIQQVPWPILLGSNKIRVQTKQTKYEMTKVVEMASTDVALFILASPSKQLHRRTYQIFDPPLNSLREIQCEITTTSNDKIYNHSFTYLDSIQNEWRRVKKIPVKACAIQ